MTRISHRMSANRDIASICHGEMAPWVMHLPCKHEDLTLIPRLYVKIWARQHIIPVLGDQRWEAPRVHWVASLAYLSSRVVGDPISKSKQGGLPLRNDTWGQCLTSIDTHAHMHTHPFMYTDGCIPSGCNFS